jgi:hypothetical protein
MKKLSRILLLISLIVAPLFGGACSNRQGIGDTVCADATSDDCNDTINPDVNTNPATSTDVSANASCVADNDCDGDGVFTSCDADDGDANNIKVKEACDEDMDGYVDLSCAAYEGARDINDDGKISGNERDVNCDVCVGEYDPEQSDADENGIGDACEYIPADTVEATDTGTDSATDAGDNTATDTSTNESENPTEEVTPENTDADLDGLAASIDPDDSSFTSWGFINKDGGKQICLAEQNGYEYIYIAGTKSAKKTGSVIGAITIAMQKPIITQGVGLTGHALGRYKNRRIQVDGVLDHSQATLDTVGYGGISCPADLEYGIYMVIADGDATKTYP